MKFSLLLIIGITRTGDAIEANCCYADKALGCTPPLNNVSNGASSTIQGVSTVKCCQGDDPTKWVDTLELCEGTTVPEEEPDTATTTEETTSSGGSILGDGQTSIITTGTTCDELLSQFPDCSCVIKCGDKPAECHPEKDTDKCKADDCNAGSSLACSQSITGSSSISETTDKSESQTETTITDGSGARIISFRSTTIVVYVTITAMMLFV